MRIHVVQKGDTLYKIAQKYNVDLEALKKMNKQLSNPSDLKPGMKVKVPTAGVPVKKEKPLKEAPKYKKEIPKKPLPKEKPIKKTEPYQPKPDGFNSMNEPLQPATSHAQVNAASEWENPSNPAAAWSFNYPPNETVTNWPSMNEMPQMAGGFPYENPMGWQSPYGIPNTNPMFPEPLSPYETPNMNMMVPEANYPSYDVNMGSGYMPPMYGANENFISQPVSPNYIPNNNIPMYPQQTTPAYYEPYPMSNPYSGYWEPNAMQNMGYPVNPMMNRSDCGCGSDFYPSYGSFSQGMPNAGMWGEPYVPQAPQMAPFPQSQAMPSTFQPSYWESTVPDGGMMPAGQPWQQGDFSNDESDEDD